MHCQCDGLSLQQQSRDRTTNALALFKTRPARTTPRAMTLLPEKVPGTWKESSGAGGDDEPANDLLLLPIPHRHRVVVVRRHRRQLLALAAREGERDDAAVAVRQREADRLALALLLLARACENGPQI